MRILQFRSPQQSRDRSNLIGSNDFDIGFRVQHRLRRHGIKNYCSAGSDQLFGHHLSVKCHRPVTLAFSLHISINHLNALTAGYPDSLSHVAFKPIQCFLAPWTILTWRLSVGETRGGLGIYRRVFCPPLFLCLSIGIRVHGCGRFSYPVLSAFGVLGHVCSRCYVGKPWL